MRPFPRYAWQYRCHDTEVRGRHNVGCCAAAAGNACYDILSARDFLRITKPSPNKPLASKANAPGAGAATGPGLEEKAPDPAASNGPAAGYASLAVTVPVEKSGMSDERLHDDVSSVSPRKARNCDVNTS